MAPRPSVDHAILGHTMPEGGTLHYGPQRALTYACCVLALIGSFQTRSTAEAGEGLLGRIRDNVRSVRSDDPSPPPKRKSKDDWWGKSHVHVRGDPFGPLVSACGMAVSSPFWGPGVLLGNDYWGRGYFPDFPYADVPGCMIPSGYGVLVESHDAAVADHMIGVSEDEDPLVKYMEDPLARYHGADGSLSVSPRNWSGRIRFEYADAFDEISRVGGHMLLSTSSRFGLDMELNCLQEDRLGTARDQLWLGDFNLIYRFAQSERAQFRTGLGMNWLDDPVATDFGFNFTYGADFFPQKPWILSATIDWGTLGSAELFRFRTSVGLIINRVEVYSGYEYLDIDDAQINALMAGVRVWF